MKKYFVLMLLLISVCPHIWAQAFSLDTIFSLSYPFLGGSGDIYGMIEHDDGKFLIYGDISDGFGNYPAKVVRFHSNGDLDNTGTFYPGGGSSTGSIVMVEATNYGYFIFGPLLIDKRGYLGEIIDSSYFMNVMTTIPMALVTASLNVYRFNDGRIMGSCHPGPCSFYNSPTDYFNLYRLKNDGTYDSTFQNRLAPDGPIMEFVKYDSTRLMIWGHFSNYAGHPMFRIARIDTAGYIDTTFKSIFLQGGPRVAHVQPDGKIIVVGSFLVENNPDTLGIVRLLPDGSLDSTFNNAALTSVFNTGFPLPNGVCPTTDGGYLMGGSFNKYDGYPRGNIVKTDGNGFIDTLYFNHTGVDSSRWGAEFPLPLIRSIHYSSKNDKYYLMGDFNRYNGRVVQPIIRLNGLSVGINEPKEEEQLFKIYPNPAKDALTIQTNDTNKTRLIQITDINGKSIIQRKLPAGENNVQVDISSLTSGIYLIGIMQNGNMSYRKFVKM